MSISELFASIEIQDGPTVATVGTFDGVHLGHQALLKQLQCEAKARSAISVALVFKEQPRAFIKPDFNVSYICNLKTRRNILMEIGIDQIIELDFGTAIQKLSAEEFVCELQHLFGLNALIVGPNAKIGFDRLGIEKLSLSKKLSNVDFIEAPPKIVNGCAVSSSAIRNAIVKGHCESAAIMLGRNYSISGVIIEGDRRGRELGFPTANIQPDSTITVPGNGIYATIVEINGKSHKAATSIGVRPTFETSGVRTIETFILDYDGDLYGQQMQIEFISRTRSEIAFESTEKLITQMNKDVDEVRKILAR
ncbi:MAG: riboflavin biosynthesis protein RibF [SAR202 cluster bacterium]|mgnify:FL=1|nr:riboflavin biosynthesis protein RibF [SAR202 cluster bacterium]|tara:strand:- start:26724 stop:27647 length:924 start_codon:yes stop_codon:yes gene_type:complete